MNDQKVLLTGASGYLGSWIADHLLREGYTVHATVRDKGRKEKVAHLEKLQEGKPGKIVLFEADLLDLGSFDSACAGCEFVIHSASPFSLETKNVQQKLIEPALQGTRNVLGAATKSGTVKKVVVTSSMAAMYGDLADIPSYVDGMVSERTWNTTSSEKHNAYSYSKTVAEKEAWKLASPADWDLAIINPGFIMGPSLSSRKDGTSMSTFLTLMDGTLKQGAPNLEFGLVDVRNVAEAHVRALQSPEKGRFLLANGTGGLLDLARWIEESFPGKYPTPKKYLPKFMLYIFGPSQGFTWKFITLNWGLQMKYDDSRTRQFLDIDWIDLKDTVRDQVRQIEADGLLV